MYLSRWISLSWVLKQSTNKLTAPLYEFSTMSAPLTFASTKKLSDGNNIPLLGLGTYQSSEGKEGTAASAVEFALRNGYRLIDTAEMYKNEVGVGIGIKKSGVPREEIYVVTKLSVKKGFAGSKQTFLESLKKLNTGYVDLYLIHTPKGGFNLESYDAMIELQKEGLIRSIGVSNFGIEHLKELKKANKPTPVVNQIEIHPRCRHESVVDYCNREGIAVMGFCPLGRGKYYDDPLLTELAIKYKNTPAHIMLRWSVQSGFITIPKSEKNERILANSQIYNFNLSQDEMKRLNSLPNDKFATEIRLDIPWEG